MNLKQAIEAEASKIEADLIALRRQLHSNPEIAYHEFETAKVLLEKLACIEGIVVESGIAGTGIKVVLEGNLPGPVIALRADMDALPIEEKTGLPYQSKNSGVMHACGHDGHTTCLLGAVFVLSALRDQLRGTVVFLFQPAEELEFGAQRMIEKGVLLAPRVEAIFALHAWPDLPLHATAACAGPAMAGYRDFDISVFGKGAHAAMPDQGVDPVLIAAQIVVALQSVVSRSVHPTHPLVVTVAKIQGGKGRNVIPAAVHLSGTTRFYDAEVGRLAKRNIERLVSGIAGSFGGSAEIQWVEGAPPVVNDRVLSEFFNECCPATDSTPVFHPAMTAEDFAFYQQSVPGVFWGLGVGRADQYPLHHPCFDFADEAIKTGVSMHALLALRYGAWTEAADSKAR